MMEFFSPYFDYFTSEDFYVIARVAIPFAGFALAAITFYLRAKRAKENKKPHLARSMDCWDIHSRFPIYPLDFGRPFGPWISADLDTRKKSAGGWFTNTQVRIWNAGSGVVYGPSSDPTTAVFISIPKELGAYEIDGSMSNDPALKFRLGRPIHSGDGSYIKIPVQFDRMPASKGILLGILHNAPTGGSIQVFASSGDNTSPVIGSTYVIRQGIVSFMNRSLYVVFIVSAAGTIYLYKQDHLWMAVATLLYTFSMAYGIFLHRSFTVSPDDLSWEPDIKAASSAAAGRERGILPKK